MTPQNIYDDPDFFAGYRHLRETGSGLNEVLEQPALRALLPTLKGRRILELGCGMGQFARWCIEQGAAEVTGVDVSARMLEIARQENRHPQITYLQEPLETLQQPEAHFDLIVSSLALHYIEDYAEVTRRVFDWLRPGACFVFSVEHPITSAEKQSLGWIRDEAGQRRFWPVDNYREEGRREQNWFVEGVVKYHRTMATYLNTLIETGFRIERVDEPEAVPEALITRPELADQARCPPFLLIRAARPADSDTAK